MPNNHSITSLKLLVERRVGERKNLESGLWDLLITNKDGTSYTMTGLDYFEMTKAKRVERLKSALREVDVSEQKIAEAVEWADGTYFKDLYQALKEVNSRFKLGIGSGKRHG